MHCNFTEFSSRVIGKLDAGGEAPLQPWVAGRVALGEPSQHSVAISGDDDDRKATIWINFTDQLAVCRLAVCQLVRLVDEQQPIVRVVDHLLDVAAQIGDAGRHVLTAQDTGCFERLVEGAHGCGFAGSRVAEKHKVAISGDTRESRLPLRAPLVEQQRVEKTSQVILQLFHAHHREEACLETNQGLNLLLGKPGLGGNGQQPRPLSLPPRTLWLVAGWQHSR